MQEFRLRRSVVGGVPGNVQRNRYMEVLRAMLKMASTDAHEFGSIWLEKGDIKAITTPGVVPLEF